MTLKSTIFDLQGLTIGVILTGLGVWLLKSAGLVTGQAAGIALLASYVLPGGFGVWFTGISLPFLILAWSRRGKVFTLRTLLVVAGISVVSETLGYFLVFEAIRTPVAAVLGGVLCGIGVLAVFRHNASPGGLTVLALVFEQRFGIKAGYVQLGVDAFVFLAACLVLSPLQVLYSFLAAGLMSLTVLWNFDIRQVGTGLPSGAAGSS